MRWLGLAVIGIGGIAVLMALGVWQVQRLGWKTAMLDEIEARIGDVAGPLPETPDPAVDRYLPVEVTGRIGGAELHVLTSTPQTGAGYRIIAPMETGGRRVLVDLGVVPNRAKDDARGPMDLTVIGNLQWPRETDRFTPDPERERNIWFARDVPLMAEALGTEEVMIIARTTDPEMPGVITQPIGTQGIPNDHLQYAITWFSIAALWAGMTVLLGWRMAKSRV